jgi:antitoxin (DNA-binding transcriptional repressor) of toxin-antitoxin stability system
MSKIVSKSAFKARALELFRYVENTAERVVITDRGRPVLEIRPFHDEKIDPITFLKGSVKHYERPTDPVGVDDWSILK